MGGAQILGPGVGAGVGVGCGFGVGFGFGGGSIGLAGLGAGGGCGVGVGFGWGYGLAWGAQYIDTSPKFEETKKQRPNLLQHLQKNLQRLIAPQQQRKTA